MQVAARDSEIALRRLTEAIFDRCSNWHQKTNPITLIGFFIYLWVAANCTPRLSRSPIGG